ncbi:YqaE/Pmp3 family membrane protein [Mesonia aestuariivivens]|uniref:YqaE/Pmp3 family membrane protein n=1 Tax=Mesonia aestuariivivens TaxID=2796128 RepID=A0ABS6VYZ8_9FLAO|nr:YqaE/Pmp3 family membrane protein [Mesonia aestuariivivens]MBW2960724.1 YqaE/Pmp3 family membrane protein [Mesonia aestuariivivens]
MSLLTIIFNIILPPVGVFLNKGIGKDFIINLILTLIFWLPGVIHAFYVTSKK